MPPPGNDPSREQNLQQRLPRSCSTKRPTPPPHPQCIKAEAIALPNCQWPCTSMREQTSLQTYEHNLHL